MSSGSAKIKTTLSPRSRALSAQNIGVDLKAAATRQLENEYKYTYDFGYRQFGDSLVDFRQDSINYTYPQDVELIVRCQAEQGYRLAHAQIKVDQSSEQHEASIIDGGIGEDHLTILITARTTFWFNYESRTYAKKLPLSNITEVYLEIN